MPTARAALAVAVSNGKLYAIGGRSQPSGTFTIVHKTVEAYDPLANEWTTVTSMPQGRAGHAAAVGPNGEIYAIGGLNTGDELNTVSVFDPATGVWAAAASMSTARYALEAVSSHGKIYAIGGASLNIPVTTVEAYDPLANTWTTVASLQTARAGFGSAVALNGEIYAMGGKNLNTVELYHPATDTWTTVAPMSTNRHFFGGATSPDGSIYAIGGGDGVYLNTVEALTFAKGYILYKN
jgi:N-acetylneuraminic acid mutarotase